MTPRTTAKTLLALDVGTKRVGVAVATAAASLPRPLTTLQRGDDFWSKLQAVIATEHVDGLVIGLPRGLDGQETAQTAATEAFIAELRAQTDLPVHRQDEALTSQKAQAELQARGRGVTTKGEIDALAATYILEDYLAEAT